MSNKYGRRDALKNIVLGSGALGLGGMMSSFSSPDVNSNVLQNTGDKINHSVCRWPYADIPLEEFARACAGLGIQAIDLLKPAEWDIVEKYGLKCSMATDDFAVIEHGFNDPLNHAELQKSYRGLIDKAAAKGVKNVICFSGNRRGMDNETGIENCATGLVPLLEYAEGKNVNLVLELLNSKVNHPDYHCDHTVCGV
jgi:hydroxypyruvate isomerase